MSVIAGNLFLYTLIIYFPALVANGSAPFVKNGTPIDFRRNFIDGRRILGDGKSFEGLLLSISFGTSIGLVYSRFLGLSWIWISAGESLFAMLGDMFGAFIKRRLGLERGQRALGLDQWDFIIFTTLWFLAVKVYVPLYGFLFILAFVFGLHLLTNFIAYKLGIKSVPW
ncbi:MAG: CDP-2,3-bis-(O-geranylgeranyl)-sn-glycerol synthase [Sulfolobaceae archaeon]|nr:CDP-2,3-bis-(O-geranylgeranyl)-sn-glycerol synthase [Sulfolobaceae archaeon]